MFVKFLKPWKDFKEGVETDVQEGIAEGLILGGIVKNIGFESKRDADSRITGLAYKKANLKRVQTEILVHERKLEALKKKEISLNNEIESLEEEKETAEKAISYPPKDKMFRKRESITKGG